LIVAFWIAIGWKQFFSDSSESGVKRLKLQHWMALSAVLLPLLCYYSTPVLAKQWGVDLVRGRTVPFRDNAQFYLLPDKHRETGARDYATRVFEQLPENALLLADFTIEVALSYFQEVEGIRPDVELHRIDRYLFSSNPKQSFLAFVGKRIVEKPVYLADNEAYYYLDELSKRYRVEKVGLLMRVTQDE